MSKCGSLLLLLLIHIVLQSANMPALQQQPAAPLQVLKIGAGPSGAESNGVFALTEERSIFSRSSDREVFVFFQWQGVPGPHKLVAQWRSPDGALTSSSAIDYVAADRRFGAYWQMALSPAIPLGTWSIEATVDGQPAGRFTFDVRGEPVASAAVKRPLSQAELYERLNRMFVVLERSVSAGKRLDPAAGVLLGSGRVHTVMSALDGADSLRAVSGDGSRREVTAVLSWNRREDWAILAHGTAQQEPVPFAAADGIKVGDRCFSMEGNASGGRVLTEGTLSGQMQSPGGDRRFLSTFLNGSGTPGAPVVNEFGELVGIVGGANVPGASRLIDLLRFRAESKGVPIVPASLIRVSADPSGQTIANLHQRGELVRPLVGEEHVMSGGFAREIVKGPLVGPSDQRDEFSSRDKGFVAFVTWSPQARLKGQTLLRIYDVDNHLVGESKPGKADFRKGQLVLSSWQLAVPTAAGLYRVDVQLDANPIWRGFIRITP